MYTRTRKPIAFMLALCMCVLMILTMLISSGVVAYAAASSTYTNELWLLCDYGYGMSRGTEFEIEGGAKPFAYETGTAYIPLSAVCLYSGASYTLSGQTVTVTYSDGSAATLTVDSTRWSGGEFLIPVILVDSQVYVSILAAKDIFGYSQTFYNIELGLVVLSTSTMSYNKTYSSRKVQIDTLSKMLFDRPSSDTIYSDFLGTLGVADAHPRLLADQDTFDALKDVYLNGAQTDEDFYNEVNYLVNQGALAFIGLFVEGENGEVIWKDGAQDRLRQPYYIYDENGNRLVGESTYTYTNEDGEEITLECDGSGRGDGYDVGGRSNVGTHTLKLKQMAFAWQITGEDRYADAFYMLAMELDKWEHWGEGHFLNVADGAVEYALGFDWIYHAFDDEPEKRDEMASVLYNKGLQMGYYSIKYNSLTPSSWQWTLYDIPIHVSYTAGSTGWRTINRENNWQTVCGSGMIISALALMEYEEYRTNALYVIENYLVSNEKCVIQYAPDGSYIESPAYWGYGTNTLVLTLAALESCCGEDYGLLDTIGLHDSFYYAVGIADSDFRTWNYHDQGSSSVLDYSSLYYIAGAYGDPTLAAIRNEMIFERGRRMSYMDVLYYDPQLASGSLEDIALDYNFVGIDTATFRSSWEEDSLFTGLHTGPNKVTHGDFDCGNFILTMGGVQWVTEPGTENYNIPGFWSDSESGTRYHLYGKSIEGHSTVMIRNDSSLPLGQKYTQYTDSNYATIDTFYSDDNGGYAVSDMTVQYGSACVSGYRGVLLTNSRTTVVLQDEIEFSEPTSLTSVLNLQHNLVESDDGRSISSILWREGERLELRVTLISDNQDLRFRVMGADETVYDETYIAADAIESTGQKDAMALDPVQRVVIEADNVTEYKVALVFELIRHEDEVVGYGYTPMSEWTTCTDEWVKDANDWIEYPEEKPTYIYGRADFARAVDQIKNARNDKVRGDRIRETWIITTSYDKENASVVEKANEYLALVAEYNEKLKKANEAFEKFFLGSD